jgi:hypothetical protein
VEIGPAVTSLSAEPGTQFDAQLLDTFVQMAQVETLQNFVGHSQPGVPMVHCRNCGPVITVAANAKDGDIALCRVCGTRHRLHRDGDTFAVEPLGTKGSAGELQPFPERDVIGAFIDRAPEWIEV